MDKKTLNFAIQLLLIATFFLAATIEFGHGSIILGIIYAIILIIILSKVKIDWKIREDSNSGDKRFKLYAIAGILIIISVLVYNYTIKDSIGTLDMMTLILGSSIFACSVNNTKVRRFGIFGAYMSFSFLVLYAIIYSIFVDYLIKYNYYFVLVPSVNIANAVGISMVIDPPDVVRIFGVENIGLAIGSTCNGVNSMFLLVSLVIGYSFAENILDIKKTLLMALIALLVAYLANILRILILFFVAYRYGLELMLNVHFHAGWIIFSVNAMIFLYILNRLMEYRFTKVS
jgi:archaeosortase C (PEF-CTERM variant)